MTKVAPVITKIAPVRKLMWALFYWGFGKRAPVRKKNIWGAGIYSRPYIFFRASEIFFRASKFSLFEKSLARPGKCPKKVM